MDPITTSLLVAQGLAGLGKTGYGLYQQRAGKNALAGVQEASRMKPEEYAQMLREAKKGQAVQNRIDEINKSMATSTEALAQQGSRALIGGIGKVTEAGTSATNQLLGQQQTDIMRALSAGAMGSERKIARDTRMEMMEKQSAQNAINAGVQNTVSGIADIGSTLGYTAAMYNNADKIDLPDIKFPEGTVDLSRKDQPTSTLTLDNEAALNLRRPTSQLGLGTLTPEEEEEAMRAISQMNNFNSGGMVTDGPFSHDTNPIHMIQDGQVIGEMTGGEYVLNPSQAKAISKESKYFRSLLKKKRFK